MATKRAKKDEEEAPDQVDEEQANGDETPDEEEIEDAVEEQTGTSGLQVRIEEDSVEIDMPRDGNEEKTLKALAQLLKGI